MFYLYKKSFYIITNNDILIEELKKEKIKNLKELEKIISKHEEIELISKKIILASKDKNNKVIKITFKRKLNLKQQVIIEEK